MTSNSWFRHLGDILALILAGPVVANGFGVYEAWLTYLLLPPTFEPQLS